MTSLSEHTVNITADAGAGVATDDYCYDRSPYRSSEVGAIDTIKSIADVS